MKHMPPPPTRFKGTPSSLETSQIIIFKSVGEQDANKSPFKERKTKDFIISFINLKNYYNMLTINKSKIINYLWMPYDTCNRHMISLL